MSNKNRELGMRAERYYASLFRDLGYKMCKTSRYASRLLDDTKIDLDGVPLNIQIKAGKQQSLNAVSELLKMKQLLEENYHPNEKRHEFPCLVVHKKTGTNSKKGRELLEMVSMTFKDFVKIITNENGILDYLKEADLTDTEYKEEINKIIKNKNEKDSKNKKG